MQRKRILSKYYLMDEKGHFNGLKNTTQCEKILVLEIYMLAPNQYGKHFYNYKGNLKE